jgi:hypothetical protein
MRAGRIVVTALVGTLLLAPPMLGHTQASHGNWHHRQVHYGLNSSICGAPRFDFWYGYYYYPGCRCLDHGWWRLCRAG